MKKKLINLLLNTMAIAFVFTLYACKPDEPDPVFADPVLAINGDAMVSLKPDASITVTLDITAEGGLSSVKVNKDGGFLEEIDITDPTATTFEYTGQSVPSDAVEGSEINYEFIGVNTQKKESAPVAFDVSVAVYDLVSNSTVGDVYEVTIPVDGNVPDGTTITFSEDRSYYIASILNFEDGSGLVVEAGVTIYLNADAADLVFIETQAAAGVDVQGTADKPVVMTSSRLITGDTPEPGDWDTFELEGTAGSTVRYLRIEYATEGFRVDDCDDTNTIEYVSVFRSSDEGIYITGGNVNAKYLAAIETGDSNFRLGNNYSGNLQFLVAFNTGDGGEAFYLREDSDITLANITVVGPGKETNLPPDEFGNTGVRFRSSVGGKMYNAVVTGIPDWGVRAQEVVPTDIDGALVFAYSNVYENDSRDKSDADIFFTEASFNNSEDAIAGIAAGSIVPTAEEASSFDPSTLGSFFSAALFKGAIQNSSNDWTVGWVKNPDGTIR